MNIEFQEINNTTVITPREAHLDASNYRDFKNALLPIMESGRHLILDLQTIDFIDSSGIGALLTCLRQVTARGDQFRMCNVSEQVRSIFSLVRMERIAPLDDTLEDSINALSA
jgi:anti-sigma B factor antagonist